MSLPLIDHDKANHFIAGVLLFAVGHFLSIWVGLGLAVAYGIGKEVYDYYDYGAPDWKDMLWTWAGGLVGLVCYL